MTQEEITEGNRAICENCSHYYTAKTDDGRFHRCENPIIYEMFKTDTIVPEFGCVYFSPDTAPS